ncbi:MAG TPA: FAD-binding oxidoreductase, partial [Steroidobacteraceae bacterium]
MDAVPGAKLVWQEATVARIVEETPAVKSFFLKVPEWRGFMAGQHVDVRLSAPDGYQAQRSYSIGSAPESDEVELVIEKLDDGEVSPFFHDVVQAGDAIEMRGPIGGHFTWGKRDNGPLLLVGGGSGVVPMMSILRHRMNVAPEVPAVLVYSVRHYADIIFREELFARAEKDPNFHLVL